MSCSELLNVANVVNVASFVGAVRSGEVCCQLLPMLLMLQILPYV